MQRPFEKTGLYRNRPLWPRQKTGIQSASGCHQPRDLRSLRFGRHYPVDTRGLAQTGAELYPRLLQRFGGLSHGFGAAHRRHLYRHHALNRTVQQCAARYARHPFVYTPTVVLHRHHGAMETGYLSRSQNTGARSSVSANTRTVL